MIDNYKIDNNILYIELDYNYEFGSNNRNIKSEINKLLSSISTNIKKIIITCGGIIIGSIIFLSNNISISNDNIKYVPNIKENTILINNEVISDNYTNDNIVINDNNTAENNENAYNYNENYQNSNEIIYQNNIDDTSNYIETTPSVSNDTIVTVYRSNGNIINITLEEYITGVVAAEMPASFNIEALKSLSVAARTYALNIISKGKTLTDTISTQSYIDENQMRDKWGSSFDYYYNRVKDAVYSTKGEYLTYNGEYIEAMYHSTSNGKTESSLDVFGNYYPYLISVDSYDTNSSSYLREIDMDLGIVSSKLGLNLTNNSIIEVLSYTDGGNIKEINIDGTIFTGKTIRQLLGIRSTDFDINIHNNIVTITTRGYGHGVGLSQYGAQSMANDGYNYKDILYHYYPGTLIEK